MVFQNIEKKSKNIVVLKYKRQNIIIVVLIIDIKWTKLKINLLKPFKNNLTILCNTIDL